MHDVVEPGMIRQLPRGHALVVRGGLARVIARTSVAWKDRAYKRARRARTAIATLDPAPAYVPIGDHVITPLVEHEAEIDAALDEAGFEPEAAELCGASYPWSAR